MSLVVPVFNEEAVLPELLRRVAAVADAAPDVRWEWVFVDDGSRDGSLDLLRAAAACDARVRVLALSRNFGFQAALAAGLDHAGGDAVVTMDADLQDPPELIPALVAAWRAGHDVVLAVRRSRRERGLRRLGFELHHLLFRHLSDIPVPPHTGTFGLLSRRAVAALATLEERHRFFPGLRAWLGFPTAAVPYDRQERAAGRPGQTLRRLVRYALDGVLGFSRVPLRLVTVSGLFVSACGFVIGLFFALRRILGLETAATGFTTIVVLIITLGGIQLVAVGILGEYLGRLYEEAKRRPRYLVRERTGFDP